MRTGLGIGLEKSPAEGGPLAASVNVNLIVNEKPASPRSRAPRSRAFALVATLLMVAVITGAAVAFFQSTRIERFVTRNYADLARARLAAEGGAAAGQALITALFTNYPDSAVAWALLPDVTAGRTNGLATFWFRTTDPNGFLTNGLNAATPASRPVFIFAYPLASGAGAVATNNFNATAAFPATNTPGGQTGLNAQNSIDLNADNWIGTPPAGSKPVLRAKWIEVLQDPARPKDTNLNAAGFPINPAVARYAFWAEDESFRVNVNLAGITPRSNNTPGTSVTNVVLQGALAGNDTNFASGIFSLQRSLSNRIPSPGTIALASGYPANGYEANKFVVTTHSSALNLSRGGTLRLNLNQVVSTTTSNTVIRQQLDRILAAITNQSAPTNTNIAQRTAAMPDFGQRFYRTNLSSNALNEFQVSGRSGTNNLLTDIYLQKIAANIRDYIDTDFIPTVVNNVANFPLRATNANPWNAVQGSGPFDNEVAAVGKEPLPLLTEFAVVQRYVAEPGNNFRFNLGFYFEFWNPTTNSISLTNIGNPTLTILNLYDFQVARGGGSLNPTVLVGTNARPRPFTRLDLPLSEFVGLNNFPPNSFVVLTTDTGAWPFGYAPPARLHVNPGGLLTYSGSRTAATNPVQAVFGSPRAGTSDTDYDLWMSLAGNQGTIESFSGLSTVLFGAHALEFRNISTNIIRISSLIGNSDANITARSGDPRSLNEPVQLLKYGRSSSGPVLNRYSFASASNEASSFGFFTGSSRYTIPTNWSDYVPDQVAVADPASISPYRHLNTSLDTVGRLGDVYDPARRALSGTLDGDPVQRAAGGGRTFKIGQAERQGPLNTFGLWDGSETSASRNWTSWRLVDVFSVNNSVSQPGVLNINGALRDNGAGIRALAYQLRFDLSPEGDRRNAGQPLRLDSFVDAVRNHSAGGTVDLAPGNDRVFWERGQLGELADAQLRPILSSPLNTLGVRFNDAQDRGREELVRRMLDLITTKGNTYTVYAIGQSLNPRTGQPIATQRMRRTFRIDPVFSPGLPADNDFDPTASGTGLGSDRFRRPSSFTVSTLQTSLE